MYLKGLELDGFKSFSKYTHIEFNRGIISIVGPNGSGKSNILDAILWVLGEQSYKSIRASNSKDVIFSGGKNNRGASSATVSLIIENSDRYLDFQADEIKITRRVYKNGDGEYFINEKKSRLRDIQNLFMDTGIGKQAYSIISQGRVERIIGSNPKEIREIIEEAAGTKRAKVEKEDALKKLDNVKIELDKIIYVEKELYLRVKKLKDESEKASLYKSIIDEIEIKSYMIDEFELDKLKKELEEYILIRSEIESENQINQDKLNEINEIYKNLISKKAEDSINLEKNKELLFNISEELEILKNKLNEKKQEKSNFEVKLSEKLKMKDRLLEDESILLTNLEKYKKEINQLENELIKKNNIKEEIEEKLHNLISQKESLEEKIIEKEKILKELEFDIFRKNSEIENYERKIKASEINLKNLEIEKKQYFLEKENIEKELLSLNKKYEKENEKHLKEINETKNINENIKNIEKELKELLNLRSRLNFEKEKKKNEIFSKTKSLEEYSFANKSVKYILENYKNDGNIIAIVSSLLQIPSKYLIAISGLMSFNSNDIVIKNSNLVNKYINELKNNKIGNASFLPLDNIKISNIITNKPKENGVIDFARNLINYDKEYEKLILHIFSNSLVVENIDVATKILKNGFLDRIITLDGDIISARGRISGGFKKNKVDLSLLQKDDLKKLNDEYLNIKEEIKKIDVLYEEKNNIIEKLRNSIVNAGINVEFNELKSAIEEKKNNINLSLKKINTVNVEIEITNSSLLEHKNKIFNLNEGIKNNKENLNIEFDLKEDLEFEISKLENVEKYESKLNKLIVETAVLNEKLTNLKEKNNEDSLRYNKIKIDLEEIYIFENDKNELFRDFNMYIDEYSKKIDEISLKKGNTLENISIFERKIEKNIILENENLKNRTEIEKTIFKNNTNVEKISEKIGRNEKTIEILLDKLENMEHKKEEIILNVLYNKIENENDIIQIKKEINILENKRKNIGGVNLSSIEEYESENDRYLKLVSQREDLEKSSKSIKELIFRIENEMSEKFSTALKEIRNNFKYMCNEIFYGAKADIKMTNPEDILSSGLELGIKYKNKPEQTLTLLSGGEKSMLAVSFIMAIFMFKPSPFTFFDEIEAALDEANTKKIIELLRRFIEKSQFILITHNKETMKGSDRLYGVTMNKEVGESRIVAVDI